MTGTSRLVTMTHGGSGGATSTGDASTQEVRLAVVMTGGASLAVWMGGVAREINLLTSASERAAPAGDTGATGATAGHPGARPDQPTEDPTDAPVRARYRALTRILDVEVGVDVLSGTSAGGINVALLGYANVHETGLGPLRELWISRGSLGDLMRLPTEHAFPSLLRGDAVMLPALNTALRTLEPASRAGSGAEGGARSATKPARPTSIFITTTILRGEPALWSDALGGDVHDLDYRGLFVFGEDDLTDPRAAARLALAARASSAFPGAFEPAYIPVRHAPDALHPDMAEYVNAARAFHGSDGGILVNRPIGPALQAIFDRPAQGHQVRRVLTYVVPSPHLPAFDPAASAPGPATVARPTAQEEEVEGGSEQTGAKDQARRGLPRPARRTAKRRHPTSGELGGTSRTGEVDDRPAPLSAGATLLGALGAALNQSIGTDLHRLREHNDTVRGARASRRRLLRLAPAGGPRLADDSMYAAYRRREAERAADSVVAALTRLVDDEPADGVPPDAARALSEADGRTRLHATAVGAAMTELPQQLPGSSDLGELWRLGRPAVDAAKGTLISMINEGYVLATDARHRAALATFARSVHGAVVAPRDFTGPLRLPGPSTPANRGVFTTVRQTVRDRPGEPVGIVAAEATRRWLRGQADRETGRADLTLAWSTLGSLAEGLHALFAEILREVTGAAPTAASASPTTASAASLTTASLTTASTTTASPPAEPHLQPEGLSLAQRRAVAARTLADFVGYLPPRRDEAMPALLDLYLVTHSMTGGDLVDQPVELVQVSADISTALDPTRSRPEQKLTGLQLGNFGAFAKASWRANDWMWGRLDGAGWLVRVLLDPRRLVWLRDMAGHGPSGLDAAAWRDGLIADLTTVAGTPPPPTVLAELATLIEPNTAVPPGLPETATWVAAGIQREIAATELVNVSATVRHDIDKTGVDPAPTKAFLDAVDRGLRSAAGAEAAQAGIVGESDPHASAAGPVQTGAAGRVVSLAAAAAARDAGTPERDAGPARAGVLALDDVDEVLRACRISEERLTDRQNTPILVTTLAQTLAILTGWLASLRILPRSFRPAAFVARTIARLAFELVHDVTRGRRRITIATGAGLLGVGIAGAVTVRGVVGGLGILVALVGLLMISLTSWRRLPGGLAVVGCGLLGVIAAAGVIPVLSERLFPWLRDDAVPYLADRPWAWAAVFGLLVLPPVWSIVEAVLARRDRRG